jgi:Cu+-exporting ATPase
MADTKQLTLPVTGMTCANCVATVERGLKKQVGVQTAVVNLSSERATVTFDPVAIGLPELIARVERAGYGIATGEADLVIKRLADDNDARRLEKALLKLEGVLEAQVSVTTERARVRYVPTVVSQAEIRAAVSRSGFEAVELGGAAEDAEAKAREAEIRTQRRLLITGLIFTVPLFLFSMGMDFRILPEMWMDQMWTMLVMFALATPVQFYVGWQYYVGAYKSLRNGSANMDVLIAMGSSVAYVYSIVVMIGLLSGHVYFETAAVIITLIRLGKFLEARAKGRTSEAIKKLMGLRAKTARVVRDGTEMEVPTDDVRVGDLVLVRPGETIPVDGVVVEGRSAVEVRGDQSWQRDGAGTDHPAGRGGARKQGAHPETGGPGFGVVRPGSDRLGGGDVPGLVFPCPGQRGCFAVYAGAHQHGGGAGHRLSVRDGTRHTDCGYGRDGQGCGNGHPVQEQ